MQATEALCHLSVTDIKKTFCSVWFFCKNEACVNCGTLNATTLIWLRGKHQVAFGESKRKDVNLQFAIHQTVFDVRWCKRGFGSRELGYFIFANPQAWPRAQPEKWSEDNILNYVCESEKHPQGAFFCAQWGQINKLLKIFFIILR